MAKKPSKLKSALSKIGSSIKNTVSAVKNVAGKLVSNALTATGRSSLPQATSGVPFGSSTASKTPAQTQATVNAANKPKPTGLVNSKGQPVAVPNLTTSSVSQNSINQALSSGALTPGVTPAPTRTNNNKNISLPKAGAPTDPSNIDTSVQTMNLDGGSRFSSFGATGTTGTGTGIMGAGTAGAGGALAGTQTYNDQQIQTAKQTAAEQAKLAADQAQAQGDNFLSKIFKEQDKQANVLEDKRQDLEEQYQIQAKTAEINNLQESLGKMEVEVQNQVALAQDKLGTNNFINNQVQQIARNASPELNRLRADINFKTGILTQNEALLEKAMEQATQESRDRIDNLKWFYTQHYDKTISKLDKRYDDALKASIQEAEDEHDYQMKLWEWKRDTIIDNGLEGLTPNDSEAVISRAAAKANANKSSGVGGLTPYQLTQVNNQIDDNARQDPNISTFAPVRASYETARAAAAAGNSAGDIVLMRMLAKITDPTTGVREEEYRTFQGAIGTLPAYGVALTSQMIGKGQLTDGGRQALMQQVDNIYQQRASAYDESVNYHNSQKSGYNLPPVSSYKAPSTSTSSQSPLSTVEAEPVRGFWSSVGNWLWGND